MSKEVVVTDNNQHALDYTKDQINLLRATVAKGATDDEFKLFLYRAKSMELDPLKPGQIYFIKYGNSPGTIVVGLDGFRAKAARTGKHSGTERGVLRNEDGNCIGAWAKVYRTDWTKPATEEVSLHEYNTGKAQWQKMPETMIKKVAECAALRMAFPDELGGVYGPEEMEQAGLHNDSHHPLPIKNHSEPQTYMHLPGDKPVPPADYVIRVGKKFTGKKVSEIPHDELVKYLDWANGENAKKPLIGFLKETREVITAYLQEALHNEATESSFHAEDDFPFEENEAHR